MIEQVAIGIGVFNLILLAFVTLRNEALINAVKALDSPQETDQSEVVQTVNNLRDAYRKTGKKQSGTVVGEDGSEIVLTVRPKVSRPQSNSRLQSNTALNY